MRAHVLAPLVLVASFSVPTALADHGTPYVARGTACLAAETSCMPAELSWSGAAYRVVLMEPGFETPLPSLSFAGTEGFRNYWDGILDGCFTEAYDYLGRDTMTRGKVFQVEGHVVQCIDGRPCFCREGTLVGHYGAFDVSFTFPPVPPR